MDINGHTILSEDYCSYEIAKMLKEKGFNERSIASYDSKGQLQEGYGYWNKTPIWCAAPTHQMAMKWLREEKGIAIIPIINGVLDNEKFLWNVNITIAKTAETYTQGWRYEEYEDIIDDALKYTLENLI